MRWLAVQLTSSLCRRNLVTVKLPASNFSSFTRKEEIALKEEAERKIGLFLKLLFFGTMTIAAYQFFPHLDDNLIQQSISLLNVRDPMFKRMGAFGLSCYSVDDTRIMKIVEMGGAQGLVKMLDSAKDDKTKNEALKALVALSTSDEAVAALYHAGVISAVRSIADSPENGEGMEHKTSLLKRFQQLKYDL